MKSDEITITLQPPTTEWCQNCGEEFHYSRHAMRCKCPECGEEKMRRGLKPKHTDVVTCGKAEGRYNLLSNETQFQYFFRNLPESFGKRTIGFVVDEDLDTDDPAELVSELHSIITNYLINSDKEKIQKLHDLFLDDEFIEDQEMKAKENRKQKLMADLYWEVV